MISDRLKIVKTSDILIKNNIFNSCIINIRIQIIIIKKLRYLLSYLSTKMYLIMTNLLTDIFLINMFQINYTNVRK